MDPAPSTPPTKYTVVSDRHGLHPLARRLIVEGMDVEVWTTRKPFLDAWAGVPNFKVQLGATRYDKLAERLGPEVGRGERVLVTDSYRVTDAFGGAPFVYGRMKVETPRPSAVAVGAWYEDGQMKAVHWLFPEWGLWPNGLGAQVVAGAVLSPLPVPEPLVALLESKAEALDRAPFQGLVTLGVQYDACTGTWGEDYLHAGWPQVHTTLFLRAIETNLSALFAKMVDLDSPEMFTHRYYCGAVVSRAPWPFIHEGNARPNDHVPLPHMNAPARESFWLNDMAVRDGMVHTGGTDGLVGVATGVGSSLAGARERCMAIAASVGGLPEAQVRSDTGYTAERVISQLDSFGMWG